MSDSPWLRAGWVGVEIFFVISGYVIAISAARAKAADFARHRILRLWPGALLCATISALVLLCAGVAPGAVAGPWLVSATLWPVATQIDPSYWTLGIEIAFYLLVTLLLAFRRFDAVKLGVLLGLWSLTYWVGVVAGVIATPPHSGLAELSLARFGAFFSLGVLIHAVHGGAPSLRFWHLLPAIMAAPLVIMWHAGQQNEGPFAPLTLFAVAMLPLLFAPQIQRRVRSDRLQRVAIALGVATYPLYLLHQYAGQALMRAGETIGLGIELTLLPTITIMVALALWLALKVEPLLRARLDRLLRPILTSATDDKKRAISPLPGMLARLVGLATRTAR
jgi:peptidoglycan/LPS O-acetylase OafA/YrhL